MARARVFFMLAAAVGAVGCQTEAQILQSESATATDTALRRGRFELNCPGATGSVLSSNMLQPVLWGGIERAEYSIGVSGCNQRMTYIVICPQDQDACYAGRGDR